MFDIKKGLSFPSSAILIFWSELLQPPVVELFGFLKVENSHFRHEMDTNQHRLSSRLRGT